MTCHYRILPYEDAGIVHVAFVDVEVKNVIVVFLGEHLDDVLLFSSFKF